MRKSFSISLATLLIFFCNNIKAQSVIFSEINYNSDSTMNSGNWVELYNKTTSSIDISGWYLKTMLNTSYTIPTGTSLAANSYIVIVQDLIKFNSIYSGVTNNIGSSLLDFGNNGDSIQLYDATNSLIVYVAYKDTGSWPRGADGYGHTLELNNFNGNLNSGNNWFDGCMFGSPGVGYSPCNPSIVFSEINYNSSLLMDAGDWLELHNTTAVDISLNGYTLKDSKDSNIFIFPSGLTLASNGYREIVQDVTKFINRHSSLTNFNGPFPFGFKSKGEAIRLFGSDGKLKFSVVYDNKLPWPVTPDSGGYTLELLDEHGKMDNAENWFAGCPEGSPGWPFAPGCNVGIENIKSDFSLSLQSNPVSDFAIINVIGYNSDYLNFISLIDLYGNTIEKQVLQNGLTSFNVSKLAVGIYFLKTDNGNNSIVKKFVKL